MSDSEIAIVVVAYNRPKSLSRILQSLNKANYPEGPIPLIISIDRGNDNLDVLQVARSFQWNHGEKKVVYQEKNLGLRAHILQCGDYSNTYGSVIILEDDLYVSPNFYHFTNSALEFSRDKEYIGGISLYNHEFNVHVKENFKALDDGYDNWYFQFASSWGQAWNKEQWNGFKNWYAKNPKINDLEEIPLNVRNWSEKSWLKYFIAYLIATDKFFLYPKVSLTTNFSDVGTHVGLNSTAYQVPLQIRSDCIYKFSSLKDSNSIYDAFFENVLLYIPLNIRKDIITIDLYGYRSNFQTPYILTSQNLNFKILKSYGCELKPRDANILMKISGNRFFLYDTSKKEFNPIKGNRFQNILYNIKLISLKDAYVLLLKLIRIKVEHILKK